jgi:hypothetical protein
MLLINAPRTAPLAGEDDNTFLTKSKVLTSPIAGAAVVVGVPVEVTDGAEVVITTGAVTSSTGGKSKFSSAMITPF